MKQPEGFIKRREEHLVCRLEKSIYGLIQSSCCWNSVAIESDQLEKKRNLNRVQVTLVSIEDVKDQLCSILESMWMMLFLQQKRRSN